MNKGDCIITVTAGLTVSDGQYGNVRAEFTVSTCLSVDRATDEYIRGAQDQAVKRVEAQVAGVLRKQREQQSAPFWEEALAEGTLEWHREELEKLLHPAAAEELAHNVEFKTNGDEAEEWFTSKALRDLTTPQQAAIAGSNAATHAAPADQNPFLPDDPRWYNWEFGWNEAQYHSMQIHGLERRLKQAEEAENGPF